MYISVLIPACVCIYTICRKTMYSKYMDQDVSRILGMEIHVMTFDWIASIKDTGEKPHPSRRTCLGWQAVIKTTPYWRYMFHYSHTLRKRISPMLWGYFFSMTHRGETDFPPKERWLRTHVSLQEKHWHDPKSRHLINQCEVFIHDPLSLKVKNYIPSIFHTTNKENPWTMTSGGDMFAARSAPKGAYAISCRARQPWMLRPAVVPQAVAPASHGASIWRKSVMRSCWMGGNSGFIPVWII